MIGGGKHFGAASTLDSLNAYKGRVFRWTDDWMYGETMYATVGGSAKPIGWHSTFLQGTARIVPATGTGRMGINALATGETSDGEARVHTVAAGAFDNTLYTSIAYEFVGAFEALSTVAEEYRFEGGLVGNAPGYGAFFRYSRLASGNHRWQAVTEDNGVETVATLDGTGGTTAVSLITPWVLPDDGMFRCRVIVESDQVDGDADRAKFYVNDVLVATLTTNLPQHSLAGSIHMVKTAGTTSRYFALDYTALEYRLRRQRLP